MPFSQIIQRSFEVVWRNRSLWIIGMIFAFFGGGSSGGGSGGSSGGNGGFSTDGSGGDFPTPEIPSWLTMELIVLTIVAAVAIVIILGIISLVIQSIVHTGLIEGTNLAIEDKPRGWRELLRAGWTGRWKSLLGLKILVTLPGFLLAMIGAILILATFLPLIGASMSQDSPTLDTATFVPAFFGLFCLFFCLILVGVVLQWVLSLAGGYASRAIVLDGQSLRNGWHQGWQLFRANTLNSFIMSILLAILLGVAGFIITIPLLIVLAFAIVPIFFVFQNIASTPPPLLVGGGILFVLGFSFISAILTGPLLAFGETVWTMTYRYVTGRELPAAPTPPPPPTPTPAV